VETSTTGTSRPHARRFRCGPAEMRAVQQSVSTRPAPRIRRLRYPRGCRATMLSSSSPVLSRLREAAGLTKAVGSGSSWCVQRLVTYWNERVGHVRAFAVCTRRFWGRSVNHCLAGESSAFSWYRTRSVPAIPVSKPIFLWRFASHYHLEVAGLRAWRLCGKGEPICGTLKLSKRTKRSWARRRSTQSYRRSADPFCK
jgi:hypothetical protein